MAWNEHERAWARELVRDYFCASDRVIVVDIDTVLFGGTESERKAVVRAYAREVIKARRLARKAMLAAEVDEIDAEVAVMPQDE